MSTPTEESCRSCRGGSSLLGRRLLGGSGLLWCGLLGGGSLGRLSNTTRLGLVQRGGLVNDSWGLKMAVNDTGRQAMCPLGSG